MGQHRVFVLWQSLVVDAYRRFFAHVIDAANESDERLIMELACPTEHTELGSQKLTAPPFAAPFDGTKPPHHGTRLRSWTLHTQILFFPRLTQTLKRFLGAKPATGEIAHIVCMAEPYAPTALFAYLQARWVLRRPFRFYLLACQNIEKRFPWPLRMIQGYLLPRTDGILVLGKEQGKVLRRHGFAHRIVPFPLWFNEDDYTPLRAERARDMLGLPARRPSDERLTVSFAGSLVVEKGLHDLFDALEAHADAWKDRLQLLICGRGPLEEEVRRRAQALGARGLDCQILGALPATSMAAFYAASDVLVVPSRTAAHWKEQFGRIIVEAQAMGALVIGSDSGEIPHVIGDAACVFDECSPEALAATLEQALARLTGEAARAATRRGLATRARALYSDKVLARKFWNEILGVARSSPLTLQTDRPIKQPEAAATEPGFAEFQENAKGRPETGG